MNLVDSSGWLEFFTDGPLASRYAEYLRDLEELVTPTLVVFEVYKWIKRERSEEEALIAVAQLAKTRLVPLTTTLAVMAADLSLDHGLAMADAVVYATGLSHRAPVVTSDRDFAALPEVVFVERR